MANRVLMWERLGDHGELRVFLREGPPQHLAFEVLRDSDGRAWTLRVPYDHRPDLERLLAQARQRVIEIPDEPFDEEGVLKLATEPIGEGSELSALLLREGDDLRFALWRRDLLGKSWTWTLDAVFVPPDEAPRLIQLLEDALAHPADKPVPPPGS